MGVYGQEPSERMTPPKASTQRGPIPVQRKVTGNLQRVASEKIRHACPHQKAPLKKSVTSNQLYESGYYRHVRQPPKKENQIKGGVQNNINPTSG